MMTGADAAWRRMHGPFLGLLVMLSLLGHDLLMAGDAHHPPMISTMRGAAHAAAAHSLPSPPAEVAAAMTQSLATDLRDSGCGTDRVAVLAAFQGAGDAMELVAGPRLTDPPVLREFLVGRDEPTAPPGERRALLQVFRI